MATRDTMATLDLDNINLRASYSLAQVAQALGYHISHLRRLIREGRIQAYRPTGWQWRVKGTEVKRIIEALDRHGGLPKGKGGPVAQAQVIDVTPDQMKRIDPGWQPAREDQDPPAQPRAGGFWEAMDQDVQAGFPLLFGPREV